jgi:hypothetical protein
MVIANNLNRFIYLTLKWFLFPLGLIHDFFNPHLSHKIPLTHQINDSTIKKYTYLIIHA